LWNGELSDSEGDGKIFGVGLCDRLEPDHGTWKHELSKAGWRANGLDIPMDPFTSQFSCGIHISYLGGLLFALAELHTWTFCTC
jgi:hypothetical protein